MAVVLEAGVVVVAGALADPGFVDLEFLAGFLAEALVAVVGAAAGAFHFGHGADVPMALRGLVHQDSPACHRSQGPSQLWRQLQQYCLDAVHGVRPCRMDQGVVSGPSSASCSTGQRRR